MKLYFESSKLVEAVTRFDYDDAISYIEDSGVSCDPSDPVGEYVCDLLDDLCKYDKYDEPYYAQGTLNRIIKMAKKYKVSDADEVDVDRSRFDMNTCYADSQEWQVKFNDKATSLIKKFLKINKNKTILDTWHIDDMDLDLLLKSDEIYANESTVYTLFFTKGMIGNHPFHIFTDCNGNNRKFNLTLNLATDKDLIIPSWYQRLEEYLDNLHSAGSPLNQITENDLVFVPCWFRVMDDQGRIQILNTGSEVEEKFPQLIDRI